MTAKKRKSRRVGSREADWLLNPQNAALMRDPAKDRNKLPVLPLPDWLQSQEQAAEPELRRTEVESN